MTNFDALKQIYEALGGDEAISGTNLDALKAIATVAGSGGGGGGGLVVHATEEEDVVTLDKTWQEIYDAFSAGTNVVLLLPPRAQGDPDRAYQVVFCGKYAYTESVSYYLVSFMEKVEGNVLRVDFESSTASDYPWID